MDKFWKWIEKKEYGKYDKPELLPKQMLIGYMIEYLEEEITYFETLKIFPMIYNNIDSVYDKLKNKIEEI